MRLDDLRRLLEEVRRRFDVDTILARPTGRAWLRSYYRESAPGYDLLHGAGGAMHLALNPDEAYAESGYAGQADLVLEAIDRTAATTVLDLGCGLGFDVGRLSRLRPGTTFVGVDLVRGHARAVATHSCAHAFVGDAAALGMGDGSVSLAYAVESLCQVPDPSASLREVSRLLGRHGTLVVIDCFRLVDPPSDRLDLATRLVERTVGVERFARLDEWQRLAASAGLVPHRRQNLSHQVWPDIVRLFGYARHLFEIPAASAVVAAASPRLIENAVAGLLMPALFRAEVIGYRSLELVPCSSDS